MANTTFSGPLRIGETGAAANAIAARLLLLTPTANANTDFVLPIGAGLKLRAAALTTIAYTGATVTVQVGTTVGGAEVIAATSIKAQGLAALTLTAAANLITAATTLYVRVAQTTPTAVGEGRLMIEFVPITG